MLEEKCPHCHKPVYEEDALNCIFCGASLEKDTGTMSRFRYPGIKNALLFLMLFIIIAFLLLIIR